MVKELFTSRPDSSHIRANELMMREMEKEESSMILQEPLESLSISLTSQTLETTGSSMKENSLREIEVEKESSL